MKKILSSLALMLAGSAFAQANWQPDYSNTTTPTFVPGTVMPSGPTGSVWGPDRDLGNGAKIVNGMYIPDFSKLAPAEQMPSPGGSVAGAVVGGSAAVGGAVMGSSAVGGAVGGVVGGAVKGAVGNAVNSMTGNSLISYPH